MKKILIAMLMVVLAAGTVWGETVQKIQGERYNILWSSPLSYDQQHSIFIYSIINITSSKRSVCPKLVLIDGTGAQQRPKRKPRIEAELSILLAKERGIDLYNSHAMCGELYPGARKTGMAIFNVEEGSKPEMKIYITNVFERDYMVSFKKVDSVWVETGAEWVR